MATQRSAFLDLCRLALAALVIFSHSFGLTGAGWEPTAFGERLFVRRPRRLAVA